ncbi:aromatic ring-hydroxylating dioxygenase subunit alpha [Variovorax sp. J31P207]|uniref:aromatic ring-hydroxylating dioxygenase subunit alpha n=1 Tax=Variovorax sp. J31P207 TaxID=3053510 RepID=UPI002574B3CE|nr:aromatic ring-hydroxylating dioxygenase subunit alpha [Variovorax sp. J31P207]MDM0068243.1 aromatic ring-hydroxylating dioxygenase subunit alpha [Variovorax sp. J31P207]
MPHDELSRLVREDSVHKRVYTDPAIFELEMERIYGQAWIYVGHESQVKAPGDYDTTRIGDQDVIMVRAADGSVKVLYNRCAHKGAKLVAEGSGCVGKFFRCPYHAWTYQLDGTHLSAPLRSGFEGTCYDPTHPDFSMRALARVESYRGFVFASQSAQGIDLRTFLGGVVSSIDNLCDRSPVGEVEVAGGSFRVLQQSNWKVFYENLSDTMHARVTHESSFTAAREQSREIGEMPFELLIMDGNGEPYAFWEKLELRAYHHGHGYMEGIFDPGAATRDPVAAEHFANLSAAHGEDRARAILGMNRHNTIIYGSGSPHTVYQQFRVIRPLTVDRTMIEIQLFRCKDAPAAVFDRALTYANLINSPSSNVMPDDVELYRRCQEGNGTRGGDWVSLHRYLGTDRALDDGWVSTNGTSELPMRNQFAAWKAYMLAPGTEARHAA